MKDVINHNMEKAVADYWDDIKYAVERDLEIHTHDSIPCYTGEEDNGCVICQRNKAKEVIRMQVIKPSIVKKIAKEEGYRTSSSYLEALNRQVEKMIRSACTRCKRKTLMMEDMYESA